MGGRLLAARNVVVRYGALVALRGTDLDLRAGEVTALMGRNGSGKSSLLWALQGSGPRHSGTVTVDGRDPREMSAKDARARVGLVPQTAGDLLYLATVRQECEQGDIDAGATPGTCRARSSIASPDPSTTGCTPATSPRDSV